jgi:hypothetical protein
MLAEIFMVQLEAEARASRDATPSGNSRFLPFVNGGQFVFRDSGKRSVEPERAEPSTTDASRSDA